MIWLLVDEISDDGGRLVAVNVGDGTRLELHRYKQNVPATAFDPSRAYLYLADPSHGTSLQRVCLTTGVTVECIIPEGLKGRISHLALSSCGTRIALELQNEQAVSSVYVLAATDDDDASNWRLLIGNSMPGSSTLEYPVFLVGDSRLLCIAQAETGARQCVVITPGRMGEAEHIAPGAGASGRLDFITFELGLSDQFVPAGHPSDDTACVAILGTETDAVAVGRVNWAQRTISPVDGPYRCLEAMPTTLGTDATLFAADGGLFRMVGDEANLVAEGVIGEQITGLAPNPMLGGWVYSVNTQDGMEIRSIDVGDGSHLTMLRMTGVKNRSLLSLLDPETSLASSFATLDSAQCLGETGLAVGLDATLTSPKRTLLSPSAVSLTIDRDGSAGGVDDPPPIEEQPRADDPFDSMADQTETEVGNDAMFVALSRTSDSVLSSAASAGQNNGAPASESAGPVDSSARGSVDDEVDRTARLAAVAPGGSQSDTGNEIAVQAEDVAGSGAGDFAHQDSSNAPPDGGADSIDGWEPSPTADLEPPATIEGMTPAAVSGTPAETQWPEAQGDEGQDTEMADEDDEDVWTSAPGPVQPELSSAPPEAVAPSVSTADVTPPVKPFKPASTDAASGSLKPEPVVDSDVPKPPVDGTDVPRPDIDFSGWMAHISTQDSPLDSLSGLDRYARDTAVSMTATEHFREERDLHAKDPDRVSEMIFAIAACAHLRAPGVRPDLLAICKSAYDRLNTSGHLPEAEEHFAMAAIRALDMPRAKFSSVAVYDEYEAVVAQASRALEVNGEAEARRLMEIFGARYKEALAGLIDPDSVAAGGARSDAAPKPKKAKQPAKKKSSRSARPKVDLMEGYEFPDAEESSGDTGGTDADHDGDDGAAGQFVRRFQPLASSVSRGRDAAPKHAEIQSTPSMDLFQVTALPTGELEAAGGVHRGQFSIQASGPVQKLLVGAGLIAVVTGLAVGILGHRIHPYLSFLGALWLVGGVGLIGGKRGGWLIGVLAYLFSGASIALYPFFGTLPADILPAGLVLGGGLACALGLGLLHPSIRRQLATRVEFDD